MSVAPNKNVIETFRQNPWLLLVAWGGFLIMGYLMLSTRHLMHFGEPDFATEAISSSIVRVEYYSRDQPRVKLHDGRSILMHILGDGREYIAAGDSLVKQAKTDSVTVYRRKSAYTEVSIFGDGPSIGNKYSGLVKRYRIPNPLPDSLAKGY